MTFLCVSVSGKTLCCGLPPSAHDDEVAVVTQSVERPRVPELLEAFNTARPDLPIARRSNGVSDMP